jgi:hypothetical protein
MQMLHAMANETLNEMTRVRVSSPQMRTAALHPHANAAFERVHSSSLDAALTHEQSGQQNPAVAKAQSTYGNQAVLRMHRSTNSSMPILQRKCACGGSGADCDSCAEKKNGMLHRSAASHAEPNAVPPIVHEVLRSSGHPLDAGTRDFMEPRLGGEFHHVGSRAHGSEPGRLVIGAPHDNFEREADSTAQNAMSHSAASPDMRHDFSSVQIHNDSRAAESARAVNSLAYTVGRHIVFGAGQFAPQTHEGRRLLAHELTHVLQQDPSPVVRRQYAGPTSMDTDAAAERQYGNTGAPKSQKCGRPSWCPPGFCDPYRSEKLAEYYRSKNAWWLMAGISLAVNSRVVPLWKEYLWGGSSVKDLTADFGKDFTNSPTTKKTTTFLNNELKNTLTASPPAVPLLGTKVVDLATQIPKAIAALDDPLSTNQMNFNIPKDIPGNLAGGIGKDQLACPAGAKPSPFNDERHASGTAIVTRTSASELTVAPSINYLVKDTIDLCPGDCGTSAEQLATVPLSQFEATGIAGDVPFTVDFPAPALGTFTVSAPLPASAGPVPHPIKP